ncbi:MAG TPA: hypothetical protein PLZ08_05400 [Bacillota bacterium]|jgi:hypothetical protein|nr:hypothetical protein [Bacillota bacterium]HOL10335.1 hypothetical protein [Bacillota bacterium]HPO97377.1 hypothetical protein [Bacillota bacterium]
MEIITIQSNTKVYAYTNQNAPVVSELTPGEMIQIDPKSKKSSWLKVYFPDGKYGYIIPDPSIIYHEEGNLQLGIIAGSIAAIISAILWATITLITHYQFGIMAIGVGFLVGKSISHFGKGDSRAFQISGAVLALL